jgi:2-hydroxy-3-oxopropionate reductase
MTDIAFLDVGIMGGPMAGHLQADGHRLHLVRHRMPLPEELLAGGALECGSADEAAQRAEVVITMLADTPDVEAVLLGPGEADAGKADYRHELDLPHPDQDVRGDDPRARLRLPGRPCFGRRGGGKGATLTIMVGGTEAAFERARPLFERMGTNITLAVRHGSAKHEADSRR